MSIGIITSINLNDRHEGPIFLGDPKGNHFQPSDTGVFAMLTVGDKFPQFNLKATVSIENLDKAFFPITNDTYQGKWLCVFFYPKDFTFVCSTEIKGFGDIN